MFVLSYLSFIFGETIQKQHCIYLTYLAGYIQVKEKTDKVYIDNKHIGPLAVS